MAFRTLLPGWLRAPIVHTIRSRTSAFRRGLPRCKRPRLEELEVRLAPAAVSWTNLAGGDWDTASNWSGNAVPGAGDDVTIFYLNNGATITHNQATTDTVKSITATVSITITAGTLDVTGELNDAAFVEVDFGAVLEDATLEDTVLQVDQSQATLIGVTLADASQLDLQGTTKNDSNTTMENGLTLHPGWSTTTIEGGLTLDSGVIQIENFQQLLFDGTQTLGGSGSIAFEGPNDIDTPLLIGLDSGAGTTLTIGPGVTISNGDDGFHYATECLIDSGTGSLNLEGTVEANDGGSGVFTINGNWTTTSTTTPSMLEAIDGGKLNLTGSYTLDSGTIVMCGSDAGFPCSVTLGGTSWTNDGTINATSSTTLTLGGDTWVNDGTIATSVAEVFLDGTFTLADLGNFSYTPGLVYISGTLENTGTFALNDTTGSWSLANGEIDGGTVTTTGNAALQVPSGYNFAVLDGVTLNGTLNLLGGGSPSVTTVDDGLMLNNAQINLGDNTELSFSGTQTLGGTGTVTFDAGASSAIGDSGAAGTTLTIAPGIIIETAGTGAVDTGNAGLDNQGTLDDVASGAVLTIGGTDWTNDGTIAMSGTTLNLGGTFTEASLGTIQRDPNAPGTVNITGTLELTGQTLPSSVGTWGSTAAPSRAASWRTPSTPWTQRAVPCCRT